MRPTGRRWPSPPGPARARGRRDRHRPVRTALRASRSVITGGSSKTFPDRADCHRPDVDSLLGALYSVPTGPDCPGRLALGGHRSAGPGGARSSRASSTTRGRLVHGWRTPSAADKERRTPRRGQQGAACAALTEACPSATTWSTETSFTATCWSVRRRPPGPEAVLSWKCSVRGDFLFDAAWCTFWAQIHPGIAAADPCPGCCRTPAVDPRTRALSTPLSATTATSCTSASPTWAGTSGPETRLVSPRQRGVSRRSSSAAPALTPG